MRSPAIKTVAPPGPFRHLQVDYITLPKCEGKQDVLVIVDKFSRWIECYPTSKGTAAHTAKMLVQDFIPRWGLPEQIESDQGTHFTGQVVQAICKLLKVNWKLHCPYRPQASGQVERVNRVIKERLTKLHSQGVKWTAALPAVLCSIRATSNKTVGLSPYEVVTGRPMLVPGVIDLRKADVHLLATKTKKLLVVQANPVQDLKRQIGRSRIYILPNSHVSLFRQATASLSQSSEGRSSAISAAETRNSPVLPQLCQEMENLADIIRDFKRENISEHSTLTVVARRRRILHSAITALNKGYFDWHKRPQIEFVGEMADDYGGPTREFFSFVEDHDRMTSLNIMGNASKTLWTNKINFILLLFTFVVKLIIFEWMPQDDPR
ncbi:hypothetical protein SRHO_G00339550 [Serrasalmus rhombeus]